VRVYVAVILCKYLLKFRDSAGLLLLQYVAHEWIQAVHLQIGPEGVKWRHHAIWTLEFTPRGHRGGGIIDRLGSLDLVRIWFLP